jgi:hypothetical protein
MGQEVKLWEILVYDRQGQLVTHDFAKSKDEPTRQAQNLVRGCFSAVRYEIRDNVQPRVKRSSDQQRLQYWSE